MASHENNELTREEAARLAQDIAEPFANEDPFSLDPVGDLVAKVRAKEEREAALSRQEQEERRRQEFQRLADRSREED